jgi:hypothetical protein
VASCVESACECERLSTVTGRCSWCIAKR